MSATLRLVREKYVVNGTDLTSFASAVEFSVFLDSVEIGYMNHGELRNVEIEGGAHKVLFKFTRPLGPLETSPEFDFVVNDGDFITIYLGFNRSGYAYIGPLNYLQRVEEEAKQPPALNLPPSQKFEVALPSGEIRSFDALPALREEILGGTISKSLNSRTITSGQDGKQLESKWVTLEKLASSNEGIRSLYKPVWDYTMKFLAYGALVGCVLKAIDTTITLFAIGTLMGVIWLAALGTLLLSKKWPAVPMVLIIGSAFLGLRVNIFAAVLSTAIVGCMFGIPFGMIMGTIVGHFRKGKNRLAPDAEPEGARPYLLGILLPLGILAILIPLYIWLSVKIVNWMV